MTAADVVFVGGGVIGLSAAWRLAQSGAAVTVIDAGFDAGVPGSGGNAHPGDRRPTGVRTRSWR